MTINTGRTPVKPSQVSVATSLSGSERLLATRVSGPTAPKTIAVTPDAIAGIVSVNLSAVASIALENFELPPTGVSVGVYGTSTVIPRITVNSAGQITQIEGVTAPAFLADSFVNVSSSSGVATASGSDTLDIRGAGIVRTSITGKALSIYAEETPRLIFNTVSASGGSMTADTSSDTIHVRGANNIATSITGDVLTIFNTSTVSVGGVTSIYGTSTVIPRITVDAFGNIVSVTNVTIDSTFGAQNLFATVSTSASSIVAQSPTDTLNIRGEGIVNVSVGGGILKINAVETARNMWATISASSGSTTADVSADNLAVRGDSLRISTSITGDVLTVFAVSVVSVGGATSIYGTSTIIPRITVDPFGNIVSVIPVTLPNFLLTETARLMWATVSASSGSTTANVSADNLAVRGDGAVISTSITGDVLTIFPVTAVSVGGAVSVYGTSTIIPRIQVNQFGQITSIIPVTLPNFLTSETPRLLWSTVSASSGSTTADVSADNLAIRGDGTVISTSITGDVLTVYVNTAVSVGGAVSVYGTSTLIPRIQVNQFGQITSITLVTAPPTAGAQNLWATISASSGSTTADTPSDNLAVRGDGNVISTSITGDVLTIFPVTAVSVGGATSIYGTSTIIPRITVDVFGRIVSITPVTAPAAGGAQNLFATVSASSGTITAGTPTDTLNIRGDGTNISTSITGNTLTVFALSAVSVGGATSIYGTSTIIPRLTVDAFGRIVSVIPVTLPNFLTSETPRLMWATVSASAGSTTADVSADNLAIRGDGSRISTSITGDVLTVYHTPQVSVGGATSIYGTVSTIPVITVDQYGHIVSITQVTAAGGTGSGINNAFITVSASQGAVSAVGSAALNIVGNSLHISTSITGNTLTIYPVSSGASAGRYSTNQFRVSFDVDGFGNITSITRTSAARTSLYSDSGSTESYDMGIGIFGGAQIRVSAAVTAGAGGTRYDYVVEHLTVVSVGGATSTYGTSTIIPVITVNQYGHIVSVTQVTAPAASGSVPEFTKIFSTSVSTTTIMLLPTLFNSTYRDYKIVLNNISSTSVASNSLVMSLANGTSVNSSCLSGRQWRDTATGVSVSAMTSARWSLVNAINGVATSAFMNGEYIIRNVAVSDALKSIEGYAMLVTAAPALPTSYRLNGICHFTAPVFTGIQLTWVLTDNFQTGSIEIYGRI